MMFKLSILVALVAPFVSALTVNQPSQAVNNGGSMTITWTAEAGDPPVFSVYLENPTFNNVFAVANNVETSAGTLTIQVPAVPDNQQYTVILVPINNVNQILAQSPPFNIGAAVTTALPSSTPAATNSNSNTRTATATAPGSTLTPVGPVSSSGFGSTVSNTRASTGVSSSSAPASTTSNSAALPVRFDMNLGVVASMVLSVFAGAAVAAL